MDDLGRCRSSAKLLESWQFGGFWKATLSPTIIMKWKITASWRKATHFQQNISTSMIMRKKGDKLFYRNLLRSVISGPRYWDVAGAGYFWRISTNSFSPARAMEGGRKRWGWGLWWVQHVSKNKSHYSKSILRCLSDLWNYHLDINVLGDSTFIKQLYHYFPGEAVVWVERKASPWHKKHPNTPTDNFHVLDIYALNKF